MNIQSRLIGALDGVILALSAFLTAALLLALLDPHANAGRSTNLQASAAVMEHATTSSLRLWWRRLTTFIESECRLSGMQSTRMPRRGGLRHCL